MDYAQSRDGSHVFNIHKLLNTHPEARKCSTKMRKTDIAREMTRILRMEIVWLFTQE